MLQTTSAWKRFEAELPVEKSQVSECEKSVVEGSRWPFGVKLFVKCLPDYKNYLRAAKSC